MVGISVVINTLNEEKSLPRAISSVKSFADEIVVVDMKSDDKTREVAKKLGAKVYEHKRTGYVEPARNYAISKALGKWILVLDADEEVGEALSRRLLSITKHSKADYFRIPRKNIIFGKWIKHSKWWPDYNIRFFKKGHVSWNEVIHAVPMTQGAGADLPEREENAIIHYNYVSLEDYLERMNRYTSIRSKLLQQEKYKFIWTDLIRKPTEEFLGRYFASEGYKDGVHGIALCALQAFSELITYLKVWQDEKFLEQGVSFKEVDRELTLSLKSVFWWIAETKVKTDSVLNSLKARIVRRITKNNG